MTPKEDRPRRCQYTLGSLLAFIAGLAVMLAIMLPFTSFQPPTPDPHAGLGVPGIKSQNCASCHASQVAAR
jgi:hypothetical protein